MAEAGGEGIAGRTLAMGQDERASSGRAMVDAPFGKALVELGRSRPEVVGLTADLGKYTDILAFRDAFPERFFNVGMAEQNLVAAAAGLARVGKVPFATTYGVFATRRAYDFIAIACAHSAVNVKIIAGLPGLTTGYGGTHQAIEDLALMRMVPGLVVIDPCDATEIMQATAAIADHAGPVYMRLLRGQVPVALDSKDHRFEIGTARLLREGRDVGVIATGFMTERALDAAADLAGRGIDVGVLHVATLKPFDAEAVAAFASSARRIVTAENHVVHGGLASLVAECLFERGIQRPLARVGLPDRFIECGSVPYLQERYGLTTTRVIQVITDHVNAGVLHAD
jgi:transketolase